MYLMWDRVQATGWKGGAVMKFIEGPYVANPGFGSIACPSGDLALVYSPSSWHYDDETYNNTVHLLAASLKMYEALKTAEYLLQKFGDMRYFRATLNEIQDALAKAEGRTDAPTD